MAGLHTVTTVLRRVKTLQLGDIGYRGNDIQFGGGRTAGGKLPAECSRENGNSLFCYGKANKTDSFGTGFQVKRMLEETVKKVDFVNNRL